MTPIMKRSLMDTERALLIGIGGECRSTKAELHPQFTVGRAMTSSLTICNLSISRIHCIFQSSGRVWSVCDKSLFGTTLNGTKLEKDKFYVVNHGDKIQLGPSEDFSFLFVIEERSEPEQICKKLKTQPDMNTELEAKCCELRTQIATKQQKFTDVGRDIEKLELEDKIKEIQMKNTRLEQEKLKLEMSRNKQLGALRERHNQEREEFLSQSLVIIDDNEGEALEERMRVEMKSLEDKLNTQIEDLQVEISNSKLKEQELLEANQTLLSTLEQERKEFRRRLETEQNQLVESLAHFESQQHKLHEEKLAIELNLKNRIEDLEKKHEAETSKLQDELCIQQEKIQQEKRKMESQIAEQKELAHRKLQEEKERLEQKLKEMRALLMEKEQTEEEMNKKLKEKEEERIRDLKRLREQQDAQTRSMLEEVSSREQAMRTMLEKEIYSLHQERIKIENSIKGECSKIEGESAENLKRLQEELEKVKRDLSTTEVKKQVLEKELEETNKAKEDVSTSCLKARQDVLQNFGDLMETELQCSVCSELFVTATTLNCTHTFCRHCIMEWKKKKKDCPICRTRIKSETRSIVFDNFIDKMVSNLSEDMKRHRQEIIEERQVIELLSAKPQSSNHTQRRRNAVSDEVIDVEFLRDDVISVSSEDDSVSSDTYSSSTSGWNESESSSVEGIEGEYYGGFGSCYRCGRRGHWASGCPY